MSLSRRAYRNMFGQIANLAVSFTDRILFTGLLIRAWGNNVFSDWATLMAAAGVLLTSELGFQVLLGNNLVRAENAGKKRAFDRLVGLGVAFYLMLGAVLLIGLAVLLVFRDAATLFHLVALDRATLVFALLAGNAVLRLMRSSLTQMFRGKGEVHQLVLTDVRTLSATLVISAIAVFAGAGPVEVAAVYFGSELVFGELLIFSMVRRRFRTVPLRPRWPNRREVASTARMLPWYGWQTASTHLMIQVPVLIVAWLGLAGAPLVSLVLQRTLVNFGKSLTNAVSLSIGIEIADLGQSSSDEARSQAMRVLARCNVALAALMGGGLLFFGTPIVQVWTGQAGLGSLYILLWLLLPVVVTGPAIPLQMVTYYGGRPQAQAVGSAVQIGLGLMLAVVAGRQWGAVGVAFGVGVGEAVGLGVVLPALAARQEKVSYRPILFECLLFFVGALAWSSLTAASGAHVFDLSSKWSLLAAIAIWSIVAGAPIAFLSVPSNNRRRLLKAAGARMR